MSEPRWVLSMGSCANGGGYYHYSYSVVRGLRPYCSGGCVCARLSSHREALIHGIMQLQLKIRAPNHCARCKEPRA